MSHLYAEIHQNHSQGNARLPQPTLPLPPVCRGNFKTILLMSLLQRRFRHQPNSAQKNPQSVGIARGLSRLLPQEARLRQMHDSNERMHEVRTRESGMGMFHLQLRHLQGLYRGKQQKSDTDMLRNEKKGGETVTHQIVETRTHQIGEASTHQIGEASTERPCSCLQQ